MLRDVITWPLRVGACATRLGLRVTEEAVVVALRAGERLMGVAQTRERPGAHAEEPPGGLQMDIVIAEPPPVSEKPPTPPPASSDEVEKNEEAIPSTGPTHVSEEAVFVEAFAEPGAEDGSGAEVHVEEPWPHYGQMGANEIIARLADASREELAAVALYERLHRRRSTILAAAQQQLQRATAADRDHR